jgi:hypothetical protein
MIGLTLLIGPRGALVGQVMVRFLKEPKGALIDGLLHERELTSASRERRTPIVKLIQSEQGIVIK